MDAKIDKNIQIKTFLDHETPFLHAASIANKDDFNALIGYFRAEGKLLNALQEKGYLNQNILHIAMKNRENFEICLNVLREFPGQLMELVAQADDDGDTVLHQLIAFARFDSLNLLLSMSKTDKEISDAINRAMGMQNKHKETPFLHAASIAKEDGFNALIGHFRGEGKLLNALQEKGYLNQNILHIAMKNRKNFEICLNVLREFPGQLMELVAQADDEGDTVLHQLIAFARFDSLNLLLSMSKTDKEISDAINRAMEMQNKHRETPAGILNKEQTLQRLKELYGDSLEEEEMQNREQNLIQMKQLQLCGQYVIQAPVNIPFEPEEIKKEEDSEDRSLCEKILKYQKECAKQIERLEKGYRSSEIAIKAGILRKALSILDRSDTPPTSRLNAFYNEIKTNQIELERPHSSIPKSAMKILLTLIGYLLGVYPGIKLHSRFFSQTRPTTVGEKIVRPVLLDDTRSSADNGDSFPPQHPEYQGMK